MESWRDRQQDATPQGDDLGDRIVETGFGGGRDTAVSDTRVSAAKLRRIALSALRGGDRIGNSVESELYGNEADNTLSGLAGDDIIKAAGGADTLSGGDDNDILDGRTGADSMAGGSGDGTYYVDQRGSLGRLRRIRGRCPRPIRDFKSHSTLTARDFLLLA
jgi:Ca2+-binding RTX toxin-like protein